MSTEEMIETLAGVEDLLGIRVSEDRDVVPSITAVILAAVREVR